MSVPASRRRYRFGIECVACRHTDEIDLTAKEAEAVRQAFLRNALGLQTECHRKYGFGPCDGRLRLVEA